MAKTYSTSPKTGGCWLAGAGRTTKGVSGPPTAHECDANENGQEDEDDDPDGAIEIGPELKEDANGGDLGGNAEQISVDEVPANSKFKSRVNQEAGMANKTARDLSGVSSVQNVQASGQTYRQQGSDFSQGELHGTHDGPYHGVAQQGT